jgi:hypothetical protein
MTVRSRWFALAVAVIVGAAAVLFALAGRRDDAEVGDGTVSATGPMSVWPEDPFDPVDALTREQTRVEAGRDAWRLHSEAVVAHFVQSVFGWIKIEVDDVPGAAGTAVDPGPVTYRAREDCGVLCEGVDDGWIEVTVDRLLDWRAGTVWSVVAVHSDRLRLPVEPGDTVVAGDALAFRLDVSPDRHAAVGVRFLQLLGGDRPLDCGHGFAGDAGVTADEVTTTVPDPLFEDASCRGLGAVGYVFAYTTARLTVQTGDPLLEPVYLADLSIVPVHLSQDAGSSGVDAGA